MTWLLAGNGGDGSGLDREALTALVLRHLDSAHNLARWIVKDASLAEDVVQDAVVRALRYRATYDGGDGRAWLMRIVRNVAYDTLAACKRPARAGAGQPEDSAEIERVADQSDDPEYALSRKQDHAALALALEGLADDLRECLVLRELEGLSYKEIARVTGVPVGTVMSRLWRARRNLMEIATKGTVS